jgi:tripartite-type tricarboxylate transporter receptor subunit TctC
MSKHSIPSGVTRREALQWALGGAAAALAPGALAQGAYPNKPITFMVGFPPGGQTDFAGRAVSAAMQNILGQSVVIDNKPGVNGNIASDNVLKAPPDGYRLLVGNGGNMTLSPHTYRSVPIVDPTRLTPIGNILQSSLVLVVPASLPVKTVQDFVAWVKDKEKGAGSIDYASSGAGSVTQATMELFRDRIGKPRMTHIPFKGSGPAMIDLIAGRVSCMFDASSVVAPFIKSGQLKPLLVTGATRVAAFGEVPTAQQAGLKDFNVLSFVGLYGPPKLPADIVKKLNTALNQALKDPAVAKTITDRGDEVGGGSAEYLGVLTRNYHKLWGEVVRANDIRAD